MDISIFTAKYLKKTNPRIFKRIGLAQDIEELRGQLIDFTFNVEQQAVEEASSDDASLLARIRDCGFSFRTILKKGSEQAAGFSILQALWDIGHDLPRPELSPAFFADLLHLLLGMQGQALRKAPDAIHLTAVGSSGRKAAVKRSRQLDNLWDEVDRRMSAYPSGLEEKAILRRQARREKILSVLGGSLENWHDWRWQIRHIVRDLATLEKMVKLSGSQRNALKAAKENRLPFGITPHYLSLMDDEIGSKRDAAIRAQVLPPMSYVKEIAAVEDVSCLDFMGEEDTSPFDLVTRRYPAICILKPYNTCPQICVYCQRNWEIDDVMASGAFAGMEKVDAAVQWISDHPAIHEVLITGGDPLAMGNEALAAILAKVAEIPTVERIRIGSRTLVTMPMRITEGLAALISQYREPGRREVTIMTHVQHPYEVTPDTVAAVNKFRLRGIPVYNQLVYTYYASKRFEAAALRRLLRLIGIDPYYTFNTKGKDETLAYRTPIARLLQEQQEEARLLPGLARTDEAVFNVPRQGKSYLRDRGYRNFLTILPDGARVYEFHSWEKKVAQDTSTFITTDVPILHYLERLSKDGESVSDYETIWHYF
ncbi:KamA family radical SAM protein [Thiovibrio frasassiensis]|uniref:KamA family radical SAM protein n=1 Tax=Thiovibrio frasassiensis TaxID=2984131 RepID=A0A9X4ME28_9BACT|nr:KamA family radical SAM protein [Thiovibrio frasassiensis]MDG4475859.1 KamA family radical SAM protein [Thiovibrio frasassiensis]